MLRATQQTAFQKEFPFLKQLDLTTCDRLTVKQADIEMLEQIPTCFSVLSNTVSINEGDRVILFDAKGNELGTVEQDSYLIDHRNRGNETVFYGESVLDAIYRLKVHNSVAYILWIEYGHEHYNHKSTDKWHATIYKPNKNIDFRQFVVDQLTQDLQEVRALAQGVS